jgi:hypothetical protein
MPAVPSLLQKEALERRFSKASQRRPRQQPSNGELFVSQREKIDDPPRYAAFVAKRKHGEAVRDALTARAAEKGALRVS